MVEIVDPTWEIDGIKGYESDEKGHKKVKHEGHNHVGKYPEHGIVSFNVTWDSERRSLLGLRDFHFARLRSVSPFLPKKIRKESFKGSMALLRM